MASAVRTFASARFGGVLRGTVELSFWYLANRLTSGFLNRCKKHLGSAGAIEAGRWLGKCLERVIEQVGLDRVIEQVGLDRLVHEVGLERFVSSLTPAQRRELKRRLR